MYRSTVPARLLRAIAPAAVAALVVAPAAADQLDAALAAEQEALESADAGRAEQRRNVLDYQRAVTELEVSEGAFAASLPEQLLGLGLALQRSGDHPGAIDAFKRGTHLARINEGRRRVSKDIGTVNAIVDGATPQRVVVQPPPGVIQQILMELQAGD